MRPAIIVGKDNNSIIMLIATTTQSPKNPSSYYDQFKHPILNWRKSGFSEPSWALCYVLVELPEESLLDYIGRLSEQDYADLVTFAENIHNRVKTPR